ncbi:Transient receptor potential-gamma protein [Araneus ventricosus]|uniref:Transient receptor potential-gamma protein n=1 Tax=Araneus ventricosus TaxID=182803 RepID=A0A4Y2GUH7_ARAVE|nr:Transient receptor potential-gamma protein [Araneus ventricosus]
MAHGLIPEMNAVKVVFLQPNTTSKLQPLNQGIIRSFKVFYKKERVRKVVDSIDKKNKMKPFNMLDCMRMADRAWMNVTQKTIKNCFAKACFSSVESESDEEQELHTETQQCEEWEKVSKILNLSTTTKFEKFKVLDSEVQVCGLCTNDEIVSQTISSPSSDDEEVDVPAEPNISAAQTKDAVHILRSFMDCSENVGKEDFATIFRIENLVEKQFEKRCRQVTVLDFFKKFYVVVQKEIAADTGTAYLPREKWDAWDPILIAEGLFATANIFSSLKLVYIFSVNPHLGPLQICLGRMVIDIIKFFFVYTLVLFAFACGMNQLLWYYADMERQVCFSGKNGQDSKLDHSACLTWRRFSNLFESSQTLFWASFGLIDLDNFELTGIQSYTRFWGLLMFGSYCVINVVVLLNLLIAMMNHSYQIISEHADVEWKFARTKLWLSYFEDGATVPPPFNIIPTPKSAMYLFRWLKRKFCATRTVKKKDLKTIRRKAKQASERDLRYKKIMRNLVRRYVTKEQRNADNQGVTEDDVNEIKQDISAFRFELIEIMKNSGFNTSSANDQMQGGLAKGTGGKKGRQKERRLMKGFDIGVVKQPLNKSSQKSDVEASTKSPRTRWLKLANLANGKKQVKRPQGAKWPYSERNSRSSKNKNQDSLRSRSMESISSEVTSEAEATHNDTTSSESSMSLAASITGAHLQNMGSNEGVTILISDDELTKCDRATNTDTPALKWSKLTSKLGMLTLPSRLRMAFHDATPEKGLPHQLDHPPQTKLHHGDVGKKVKARRTVSAPAPSANPKHHQLVMRSQGKTPYASIPSVSVSVQNSAHTLNSLSRNIDSVEETPPTGNSSLNSPSSPKTPKLRLQERYPVPTVHIEEEVVVKGTSVKVASSRKDSITTLKDSDASHCSTPDNNATPAAIINTPPSETIAANQPVSPHKPSNGTLGLISTVYGIEPVNKEMRTGWI